MEIKVGERIAEVNLLSKEGNRVSIEVDGKIYDVDACMFAGGQCSILSKGTSYNPFIVQKGGSRNYSVSLNYSVYDIEILDSQAKYLKMKRKTGGERFDDKIKSPMPSKVIKVFAVPGQKVLKGEFLLTIEAMKMQSLIEAPMDCVVESVSCAEGDSVMADQVLMTLTPCKE